MSDTGSCAHLRVSYRTQEDRPGRVVAAWWECDANCGKRFAPAAALPSDTPPRETPPKCDCRGFVDAENRIVHTHDCAAAPPVEPPLVAAAPKGWDAVELQDAEWVRVEKPCWVIRYKDSGEWCIAASDGFERHATAELTRLRAALTASEKRVEEYEQKWLAAELELSRLRVKPMVDREAEAET
jgi:hypothetical protein